MLETSIISSQNVDCNVDTDLPNAVGRQVLYEMTILDYKVLIVYIGIFRASSNLSTTSTTKESVAS